MTTTKIVIINLEKSKDRKLNISSQLDKLGVAHEFLKGIDGRNDECELFNKYNRAKCNLLKAKSLSKGQLGCFASHYLAWEKCIQDNVPLIILEDDITIHGDEFVSFLNNANKLSDRFECIRLFDNRRNRFSKTFIEQLDGLQLFKFNKGHMSAMGYYITPNGARKFINASQEWIQPVDITMDIFWENNVECYGISPACLDHYSHFDSEIGYQPKKEKRKRTLFQNLRRELYNTYHTASRIIHNMKFSIKNHGQK